ncbi:carbohydrate-binding protein [Nonomuraea sp. NPDC052265]|uniref:carbohydrate-binding protein n=1 Tax=Nonomuraea sp. NPDC052265 TaxID=3364374 RepID=UPI0037C524A3
MELRRLRRGVAAGLQEHPAVPVEQGLRRAGGQRGADRVRHVPVHAQRRADRGARRRHGLLRAGRADASSPTGALLGTAAVPATGGVYRWDTVTATVRPGKGAVYLVFKGDLRLRDFSLAR